MMGISSMRPSLILSQAFSINGKSFMADPETLEIEFSLTCTRNRMLVMSVCMDYFAKIFEFKEKQFNGLLVYRILIGQ